MMMARAAGIGFAPALPARRLAGAARDDVTGEAASSACGGAPLWRRMHMTVPVHAAGRGAGHDVAVERALMPMATPAMPGSSRCRSLSAIGLAASLTTPMPMLLSI